MRRAARLCDSHGYVMIATGSRADSARNGASSPISEHAGVEPDLIHHRKERPLAGGGCRAVGRHGKGPTSWTRRARAGLAGPLPARPLRLRRRASRYSKGLRGGKGTAHE